MLNHVVRIYEKERSTTELVKDEGSNLVTIKQEDEMIIVDVFELSKAVMAITSGDMFTAFGNHTSTKEQS